MKIKTVLLTAFVLLSCNNQTSPKENPNSVIGKTYRDISEIENFKDYHSEGGGVIDGDTNAQGDYKYVVSVYRSFKNNLVVFEEIVRTPNENKVKYKALDTLVVPIKEGHFVMYRVCRENGIHNEKIIACVTATEDDFYKEYFKNIEKAWGIDIQKKKIIPIKNIKTIDCFNLTP